MKYASRINGRRVRGIVHNRALSKRVKEDFGKLVVGGKNSSLVLSRGKSEVI